ncbi:imidazole glycerol phosphate synthase subunit HisH [Asticcacaulis sp. YBE204]|uniref:imidazole glycerol phosphate synthase subunit HisH n=1 Tax=Asticcacaulis sp. YBE204 TaxID=1282363 RepID=UPI0003C3FE1B|nr:imidazole glycerol phosphate synthase subunit HisH [Asticcacaulis sp. YBE204]ESQ79861.1 imidazole glycerol phosphate synthase [Asticcacaulis sp. YBE204]
MSRVAVIEIGCANTASVLFALERLGAEAVLSSDANEIAAAERVVLPGVGAAGFAMSRIRELGLYDTIRALKQPLLGVCLGQQLLFDSSEEGDVDCLGLIPGKVVKMDAPKPLVVPHMGWNQLEAVAEDPLTQGLNAGDYAYFVHSFVCPVTEHTLVQSTYGQPFAAMVRKDNVWGCQFHPERSSAAGAKILENFLRV